LGYNIDPLDYNIILGITPRIITMTTLILWITIWSFK
jgi:hypothetical protein